MEEIDDTRSMLKIAITGPESTGKSELSQALASHFQGKVLHEYAREYLETRGPSYLQETVEQIAREQMRQQNELLFQNDRHVFFDTDLLVCRIWLEHVFGACPTWIMEASVQDVFDHTLLMNIDLPWQDDPLREHPHEREILFNKYQDALDASGRSYTVISGQGNDRINSAIQIISSL